LATKNPEVLKTIGFFGQANGIRLYDGKSFAHHVKIWMFTVKILYALLSSVPDTLYLSPESLHLFFSCIILLFPKP